MSAPGRPRLLFVCSRNKRRSLTAEHFVRRSPLCHVRSAGTEPSARVRVRREDIEWADIVYVMEHSHLDRLRASFNDALATREVVVLDIPDEYAYMDPDLVDALQLATGAYEP
jgi:protein-tyrosine phosphatase